MPWPRQPPMGGGGMQMPGPRQPPRGGGGMIPGYTPGMVRPPAQGGQMGPGMQPGMGGGQINPAMIQAMIAMLQRGGWGGQQ